MEIIEGVKIGTELLVPSFSTVASGDAHIVRGFETYSFCHAPKMHGGRGPIPAAAYKPIIVTDGKTSNIYFNSITEIGDPRYINDICIFLDTHVAGTINMYFGSSVSDAHLISVSPIIVAMQRIIDENRGIINTHAYGMCSVSETMVWSYGKNRIIGEYGTISFGGSSWIQASEEIFFPYITTYLQHCIDDGLITEDMKNDIVEKQKEIMFIYENGQLKTVE